MYKDILSPAEVDETISKQWDFMEALGTGVDRNDPATWDHEQWYPGGPGSGIMGNFGVGQNSAMWHVRGVPKVKQVFADIYGTDELLTSFDGMCMFRPRGLNEEWTTNGNSWFHTDRSPFPDIDNRHYVQGLVNLVPTTIAGGGNVIVPRSHKLYKSLVEEFGQGEGERRSMDVQAIRDGKPEVFRDAIYTHLEAGDVFLWVSRHKQLAHHECDHPETFCWCGWGRTIARCTATRPATARRRRPQSCCAPAAMSA